MIAAIANAIVVILEIIGLSISISARKWKILAFYTQLSNLITLVSSFLFVMLPTSGFVTTLRYLSSCMLVMTFAVTVFVLVPMGGGAKNLLFSGNGLYHHTLCPIISVTCYLLWEPHITSPYEVILPTAVTFLYGIVMLVLNGRRKYDGPYPFLRVHNQSAFATVIWMLILTGTIAAISYAICRI